MKFKNIKAFEDFHSMEENEAEKMFAHEEEMYASEEENSDDYDYEREEEENEDEAVEDERAWGDEGTKLERFSTFNEKKAKPDFLDLDKDGNKKESMKKAAADAKGGKKDAKKDEKEDDKSKKSEKPKKGEMPAGLKKFMDKKKK